MNRPVPRDRRKPGTPTEQPRYPSGPELVARLAALRWHLPPADPKKLRRRTRRKR